MSPNDSLTTGRANTGDITYLQSTNGSTLKSEICLEVLCDFTHQSLEWQLADEQLSGFLVSPDLSEGDCTGPVSVRFLHTTGGRCTLTSCLGGQLLTWSLSSSGLTSSLLGTGHFVSLQDKTDISSKRKGIKGILHIYHVAGGFVPKPDLSHLETLCQNCRILGRRLNFHKHLTKHRVHP